MNVMYVLKSSLPLNFIELSPLTLSELPASCRHALTCQQINEFNLITADYIRRTFFPIRRVWLYLTAHCPSIPKNKHQSEDKFKWNLFNMVQFPCLYITYTNRVRLESRCALCSKWWPLASIQVWTRLISQTLSADVRSESRCALIKCVGSNAHEGRYRSEPNVRTVAQVHSEFPNAL
jgi:hypothetical protein